MKPEGVFGHKSLESSTPSLSESLDEVSLISVNSATISRSEFILKFNGLALESTSPDHLVKVKLSSLRASRIKFVPALYKPDSVKICPEFSGMIYVVSLNLFSS